jgi:site-specific DNA-methyltransferase (adenine-specific)
MLTITNEDNIALMARYADKHFDLAIVDPPYGIGEDGSKNKTRTGGLAKPKDYKAFAGNDISAPNIEYFNELIRVSKNQIIFGANHFISKIPYNSSCWIVWDKDNGNTDFADCELAWTSFKTSVRKYKFKWQGMLQENMKNKELRIHPTQKPVALYKWLLDKYAKPGDKIIDTHLGSGSIAIACHDYKFDLTACELDAEYYNKAMDRINNYTKQQKLF